MPPFMTATLCTVFSLCSGQDDPRQASDASHHQNVNRHVSESPSPYAFPLSEGSAILRYRPDILLAPVDRYLDQQKSADWWNASYFGLTPNQLTTQEQSWESPFLSAYHQYMSSGGHNGIAITYTMPEGTPACLLEADIIERLGKLVTMATLPPEQIDDATAAWHEYGHCVYHAQNPVQAVSYRMTDASRYQLELFADAFAMSQLWRQHQYDVTYRLTQQRDRAMAYAGDATHWTSPALPAWRTYLADAATRPTTDAELEATLHHWVGAHDWVAIRDANR